MFVVVAQYRTRPETTDQVIALLREMATHTLREPGCRAYAINQSVEDPTHLLFYEQYVDEPAFQAHLAAPHFERIIKEQVWPLIASRERTLFTLVAG
jgi:quinol monooxygenase YgiN